MFHSFCDQAAEPAVAKADDASKVRDCTISTQYDAMQAIDDAMSAVHVEEVVKSTQAHLQVFRFVCMWNGMF